MKRKKLFLPARYLWLVASWAGGVAGYEAAAQFSQAQKIVASDRAMDDQFGACVGISGNYAIVGAYAESEDATGGNTMNSSGSAYIFEYNGTNWIQMQKIVASDRAAGDVFGATVSISGNYAIVGAMSEDEDVTGGNTMSNAGSAYIFERNGAGNWLQVQKIVASDRAAGDQFGNSVSISGNYAIVGAFFEDEDAAGGNTMSNAGSAYIFERNGAGTWIQVQKIVASDRAASDQFSWSSVSISGNYAIVGAQYEDENAAGGNTMSNAGSAYIFERNGAGTWTQVQKIVASDRAATDHFGNSVSISGTYAIVAALDEDHDAAGGNTMLEAGSAYIFERNGAGTWLQAQKIVASDRAADDNFGNTVSISGSYAIVGAFQEDQDATGGNTMTDAGSAYIFQRNGAGAWTQTQKIAASDRAADDHLGHFEQGTSIDGTCAIVGSHQEDQDAAGGNTMNMAGSAYIFCNSPTLLSATISSQNILCHGQCTGTATANSMGGTGTYTYLWNTSPPQTTQTATGLCPGSYTVTVTDGAAATTTATVTITQPAAAFTTSIASPTNATCNSLCNGSATVTAGGGTINYTYVWNAAPIQNTPNATGLCAGSYTATVTDANGCTSTETVTITEPPALTVVPTFTAATCGNNDGTANANAGGGTGTINYSWMPTGQTTPTATGLSGGITYTVTVTDANNCSKTASVTITVSNGPNVTLTSQTNVLCNGGNTGSAVVNASGGTFPYTYFWNTTPLQNTNTANGLSAGSYVATITDANNCTTTQTVTIAEPTAITATITSNPTICNSSNGTASVIPSGGTGMYTYSWSPVGGNNANATGLAAGIYTVTVTDANQCTQTQTVAVTSSNGPNILLASQTNVLCFGQCIGSATVAVAGGSAPYTYLWNPTITTAAAATGLCAGSYVVTVTDNSGCTSIQTITITEPAAITSTITSSPATCNSTNGEASVTPGGGTGAFTFVWNPTSQATPIATGLSLGSYTVTVTDANGCSNNASVDVAEIDCPCPPNLNLTLPNAFSPNSDGENDDFCLQGEIVYCIKELKIIIYNRWGEKVYKSDDKNFCWDGYFKNKLQNAAVFVYYLEAVLISGGEVKKKGNVSLIR